MNKYVRYGLRALQFVFFAALAVAAVGAFIWASYTGKLNEGLEWVVDQGPLGAIIVGGLLILMGVPFTFGIVPVLMLCGFICKPIGEKLFGEDGLSAFWFGLFVAVLSCTIGQQVGYWLVRGLCRQSFKKNLQEKIPEVMGVMKHVKKNQIKMVLLIRLTLIPFGFQNAAFAVSSIPWLVYSLGSPVGMLPEQIMCVFVGYSVDNVQELLNSKEEFDIKEGLILALGGLVCVLLIIFFLVIGKKVMKEAKRIRDEEKELEEATKSGGADEVVLELEEIKADEKTGEDAGDKPSLPGEVEVKVEAELEAKADDGAARTEATVYSEEPEEVTVYEVEIEGVNGGSVEAIGIEEIDLQEDDLSTSLPMKEEYTGDMTSSSDGSSLRLSSSDGQATSASIASMSGGSMAHSPTTSRCSTPQSPAPFEAPSGASSDVVEEIVADTQNFDASKFGADENEVDAWGKSPHELSLEAYHMSQSDGGWGSSSGFEDIPQSPMSMSDGARATSGESDSMVQASPSSEEARAGSEHKVPTASLDIKGVASSWDTLVERAEGPIAQESVLSSSAQSAGVDGVSDFADFGNGDTHSAVDFSTPVLGSVEGEPDLFASTNSGIISVSPRDGATELAEHSLGGFGDNEATVEDVAWPQSVALDENDNDSAKQSGWGDTHEDDPWSAFPSSLGGEIETGGSGEAGGEESSFANAFATSSNDDENEASGEDEEDITF